MTEPLNDVSFSVLDLSTIAQGDTPGDAFRKSLAFAQQAERLGYKRYWFAEHHNMESVGSSATAVLIGYIAGGTSTIRVGSGGIMLPNHAPLIIAEQFGTLESLYPGRIDLGVGRAPGTDAVTSFALRRERQSDVDGFPNDVVELINYLGPRQADAKVRAIPGEGTQVPVWILGSSTFGARLAGYLGLPYGFASHFAPTYLQDALNIYRGTFHAEHGTQPYILACVNIIAADTDEEAQRLATSFYMLGLGLIRNKRAPLPPPVQTMEDLWSPQEEAAVKQMMKYSFIGSRETVKQGLEQFLAETKVDEIMVASHIFDIESKLRSMEIVAGIFR